MDLSKPRKRFWKIRITMRQLMIVIAVCGVGLAIRPAIAPWVALFTPLAWILAPLRNGFVIFVSIILFMYCVLFEVVMGVSVDAAIYLPFAIVFSGAVGLKRPILQHRKRLAALIAVNALIVGLFLIPWTTRKPFLRQLYSIKPGMSVDEVKKIMAGVVEETYDGPGRSLCFRHSIHDWRFNADIGVVTFHEGKVVDVQFLPD
jgi:hypothetical protein